MMITSSVKRMKSGADCVCDCVLALIKYLEKESVKKNPVYVEKHALVHAKSIQIRNLRKISL